MSIDEIIKLSMKLGDEHILIPTINDGWKLIRNNKIGQTIMDSEHNTEDELRKFVKKHRIFDLSNVISTTILIINSLVFILCIVNIFINSQFLRAFIFGALMVISIILLVKIIVNEHNWEVKDTIINEDIERLEEFQKKVKEKKVKTKIQTIKGENTTTTKIKPKNSTKTSTRKAKTKVEEKKEN